jgi:hypothetical protein
MSTSKKDNIKEKAKDTSTNNDELFEKKKIERDEIESDGSANAFDETETVNEDNFDDLSEK